jgi:hypothetical protein
MPEPAFPDLKPWPEGAPPADHNQPPLEARILIDFEEALHRRGLDYRAADIEASLGRAPEKITTREEAGAAGDLIAAARTLETEIKAERETLTRPLLAGQKALIARANGILEPIETGAVALRVRLDSFMDSQEPVHGEHGARVGTKTEWLFEIEDLAKLPLVIRRHPSVIEAMEKVIRGQVRGGLRAMPGVRIWSVAKANVR